MENPHPIKAHPDRLTQILRWAVAAVLLVALSVAAWYSWAYTISPASIRQPVQAHAHIRIQVLVGGSAVSFAGAPYQTPYDKDVCSAVLTKEPFHFHDHKDQFLHLHWDKLTGGLFLKHYGWNLIGGPPHTLGYRFDQAPQLTTVPIHSQALPQPPAGANYYIYTGTSDNFRQRDWNDFLQQDLTSFLKSTTVVHNNWLNRFIPAVHAHAGEDHSVTSDEANLARLNNLIGNIVIFVQKDQPSTGQVRARFDRLEPLPESSCAG